MNYVQIFNQQIPLYYIKFSQSSLTKIRVTKLQNNSSKFARFFRKNGCTHLVYSNCDSTK